MVRLTDRLDTTIVVEWNVKPQINQPQYGKMYEGSSKITYTFTVVSTCFDI